MKTQLQWDRDDLDIRNTKSMDMRPESPDDFVSLDEIRSNGVSFLPVFTGEKFIEFVNYPVIVESWEKKNFGRVKRLWLSQFTSAERNKISRYYGKFYRWYLVTGTPNKVSMTLKTLTLLQRAVNFFAIF